MAFLERGDTYLADAQGPSVVVRHRPVDDASSCDEPVKVVLECAAGHSHLAPEDVCRTPGPGARFVGSS